MPRPFLSAEWRDLLMLNYEVDPAVLAPRLPAGTELDLWQGAALVSVVGFLMAGTRVLGLPIPFHIHFAEVNLRFYVRRGNERGVVFVKEIVPKPAIAWVARIAYGEPYVALPLRQALELREGALPRGGLVEYVWRDRIGGRKQRLGALVEGDPALPEPGSEEQFITEHYWGYTRRSATRTGVYQVQHVPWRVRSVVQPYLLADVARLYGPAFAPFLQRRPRSAFLAEGSLVSVYPAGSLRLPSHK